MFSNFPAVSLGKRILPLVMLLMMLSVQDAAYADSFALKPERCVALHEGQLCYAKIKFQWKFIRPASVCIYRKDPEELLQCWEGTREGEWQMEFESQKSTGFVLIDSSTGAELGSAQVKVVWVYNANSHRQSHWRVF
jgi:hypothetical protein